MICGRFSTMSAFVWYIFVYCWGSTTDMLCDKFILDVHSCYGLTRGFWTLIEDKEAFIGECWPSDIKIESA